MRMATDFVSVKFYIIFVSKIIADLQHITHLCTCISFFKFDTGFVIQVSFILFWNQLLELNYDNNHSCLMIQKWRCIALCSYFNCACGRVLLSSGERDCELVIIGRCHCLRACCDLRNKHKISWTTMNVRLPIIRNVLEEKRFFEHLSERMKKRWMMKLVMLMMTHWRV